MKIFLVRMAALWCTFIILVLLSTEASTKNSSFGQNGTKPEWTMDSVESGTHEQNDTNLERLEDSKENYHEVHEAPQWSKTLDEIQVGLSCIGLLANLTALITLLNHGKEFQSNILLLFRHQSFIDCVTCLFAVMLMKLPHHALSGDPAFDKFICHAWHGQQIFWGATFVSIWNLVGIATERYFAVCRPLKMRHITTTTFGIYIVIIYFVSIIATGGSYFQVKMENGTCVNKCYFSEATCKVYKPGFAISTFFTLWAIPCSLFAVLYGMVVRELHLRKKEGKLAHSKIIDNASRQLTKTAITVTAIFFVSLVSIRSNRYFNLSLCLQLVLSKC